jgi:hypothetical protein
MPAGVSVVMAWWSSPWSGSPQGDLGGPVGSRRSNDVGVRWRVTPAGGVWPGDFCEGLNLLAEPRQEVSGLSTRDSGLRLESRAGARRAVVMARSAGMDVIGGRC